MGSVALSSALAVAVLMVGMWVLSVRLSDVSIVDLVWPSWWWPTPPGRLATPTPVSTC